MNITKEILKWTDKQIEEAIYDPNCKHRTAKAVVAGFVEGMVDGAVLMYPVLVGACIYWKNQALKK